MIWIMKDKYHNFDELKNNEQEGRDYKIRFRKGRTGIAIIVPHGGKIEPGTSEIAEGVAGNAHSFYSFEGLRLKENSRLHLAGIKIDEPWGLEIIKDAKKVIAIHGCRGDDEIIYLGGLDYELKKMIEDKLNQAGFIIGKAGGTKFEGVSQDNICNRGKTGMGVQLEISRGLRKKMFSGFNGETRKDETLIYKKLVSALSSCVSVHSLRLCG